METKKLKENYDEDERRLELERIMNEPDEDDSDEESSVDGHQNSTHSYDPKAKKQKGDQGRSSMQVVQKSASMTAKAGLAKDFKSQQQRKVHPASASDHSHDSDEDSNSDSSQHEAGTNGAHDRQKNRVTSVSSFDNKAGRRIARSRSRDSGSAESEGSQSDQSDEYAATKPKQNLPPSSESEDDDENNNSSEPKSVIPKNPLDLIELKWKIAFTKEQEEAKAPKKVQDFLTEDEADSTAFEELSQLQISCLNDISGMLKPNLHGTISAFDFLENSHLVIGTSTSFIFVCNLIQKTSFGMGQQYKIECGAVESLAITEQNKVLLAGYNKGHVIIWNWEKYEVVHKIDFAFKSEVTLLKIVPSRDICFIGADQSANLTMFGRQDPNYLGFGLFGGKIDKNLILYGGGSKITQLEQGRVKSVTGAEYNLIFAAKKEGVTVIMLMPKPVITNTLTKPEQEPLYDSPSISYRYEVNLHRGKISSQILMVAWGYSIATYLLVLDPVNHGKLIIERANILIFTEVINYIGFITPALLFCHKSTNVISCMKVGTLISQSNPKQVEEVFKQKMEVEPKFNGIFSRQFKLQEPQKKIHMLHKSQIYCTNILSWRTAVLKFSQDNQNWKD